MAKFVFGKRDENDGQPADQLELDLPRQFAWKLMGMLTEQLGRDAQRVKIGLFGRVTPPEEQSNDQS